MILEGQSEWDLTLRILKNQMMSFILII
jgi:hypothetical protein